jgi:hypothetical protein
MAEPEPKPDPPAPAPGSLDAIAEAYRRQFIGPSFGLRPLLQGTPAGTPAPAAATPTAPPAPPLTVEQQCSAYAERLKATAGVGLKPIEGFSYQRKGGK